MSRLKYIRSQVILFSVLAISFSSDSVSQPACDTEAVAKAREGLAYLLGIDVEVDTKRGEALLVESAELGCATTQVGLGEAYLFGNLGLEPDDEQAWYWLDQAVTHVLVAKHYNALMLYEDRSIPADKQNAIQDLQWRSEAAWLLANAYEIGFGIDVNLSRAVDLYLEAEEPRPAAIILVGSDDPNIRDVERAIAILKQCDDNGLDPGCATFLGSIYKDIGVGPFDPIAAVSWLEKGAAGGDVNALLELSDMYIDGWGVAADLDKAKTYLDTATEKNDWTGSIRVDVSDIDLAYARLHLRAGSLYKAEEYYKKGRLTSTESVDSEFIHFTVEALEQLGALYLGQGRFDAALRLYSDLRKRKFSDTLAQEMAQRFGAEGVVKTYILMGDIERATAIFDHDPAIRMLIDEPDMSLRKAISSIFLSELLIGLERYAEVNQLLERALPVLVEQLGSDSRDARTAANVLGVSKYELGQVDEAEKLLSQAIHGYELSETFSFLYAKANLARALQSSGKNEQAWVHIEEAINGLTRRISSNDQTLSIGFITERRRAKAIFSIYLDLVETLPKSDSDFLLDNSFAVSQYAMSLSVDEAIKNWTQRSIQTDPAIADAIQSLALAQDRSRSLDMLYQRSVLDSATERQAIAKQISDVNAEIQALRVKLSEMGIRAADLSESQPLSISETQAVLEEGELLLVYMTAKDKSYGWSVSRESATRFAIDSGERALRQKVGTLRRSLEAQQYGGSSPYATDVAHWLFEKFIRPGLVDHPDTKKLIIVPDGPLIGIPYPALRLSALPSIDSNGVDNSWLVAHYSVSLTPSVASLNSLRSRVSASQANRSFLGFGDPVLGEPPDDSATELESYTAYYDTRGLADPARLNSLKRLPESADELRELGNLLKGSQDDIYLGENATETKFKNIRLRDFRVLAFATHGLLAGNIVGHGEPSLVMTPPTEATMFDDGLLSSSEIASLDLDADLVILSACDTASAGADADAMGLSGLTRAFFLAGSRNVLASNWPVNSDAARQLTTSMFEAMEAAPELSYPEALQLAMLQVINSAGTEVTRHPAYWAPFVVIGQ